MHYPTRDNTNYAINQIIGLDSHAVYCITLSTRTISDSYPNIDVQPLRFKIWLLSLGINSDRIPLTTADLGTMYTA